MKTLLIGQAPGPNTDPDYPLYPVPSTSAGGRLQRLTGLSRAEYLATFDRANLLPYFPGQTACKEDQFPMAPARLAARVMRPLLRERRVVLVGRAVARAFELEAAPWHEWALVRMGPTSHLIGGGTAEVAIIPHPSGRNHWYNNVDNVAVARAFWAKLLTASK